ncbi:MAG TPA: carbamoyltransferase HypF, partial [Candidatus Acidoferrum sp.]|nr:carbamoyltransferase HypF [Candidatus Acidoferrum sp.]
MSSLDELLRLRLTLRGAVQGVGFRPFVYRLANELRLPGWVTNSAQGVVIEVEGAKESLDVFLLRIERDRPPRASIQSLEASYLDPTGFTAFAIRESDGSGPASAVVLPDIATCPDCLREVFDPANRRYLYPFTNCTNCGPRFTIIQALPYDRPNTSMCGFAMCHDCRREYTDPTDRRFHAQPTACPVCGPQVALWSQSGSVLAAQHEAVLQAADVIRWGKILALKGLGGFHLIVDARNQEAVLRLRKRKHREEKPLAVMVPSLESAKAHCQISGLEERLLCSPESPIVLLARRPDSPVDAIAPGVAPRNPYLGMMLPYTPLHHILLRELGFPVVATSGNLSDEPICIDEKDALSRLGGIADAFLVHDRPILRHVDDSIVRILIGRELVLRRA